MCACNYLSLIWRARGNHKSPEVCNLFPEEHSLINVNYFGVWTCDCFFASKAANLVVWSDRPDLVTGINVRGGVIFWCLAAHSLGFLQLALWRMMQKNRWGHASKAMIFWLHPVLGDDLVCLVDFLRIVIPCAFLLAAFVPTNQASTTHTTMLMCVHLYSMSTGIQELTWACSFRPSRMFGLLNTLLVYHLPRTHGQLQILSSNLTIVGKGQVLFFRFCSHDVAPSYMGFANEHEGRLSRIWAFAHLQPSVSAADVIFDSPPTKSFWD